MQPADFVRARLDELDAVARAVPLGFDLFDGTGVIVMPVHGGGSRSVTLPSNVAVFAGRFDPAYVLADVAAKRRIVDEFGDAGEWLPPNPDDDEPEYAYGHARALYDVIKLLAALHDGHPDFDPAWKVD